MQYDYDTDQQSFRDSLRRFVADHYDYESRRQLQATAKGWSDQHWAQWVELGVTALPFSESQGGMGDDIAWSMVVAEEFGRGLVLEPMMAQLGLASPAVNRSTNVELQSALLPGLLDGSKYIAVAWQESGRHAELAQMRCRVVNNGGTLKLNGEKHAVFNAEHADTLLVAALNEQNVPGLYCVAKDALGVNARHFTTVDGHRASKIELADVAIEKQDCLISDEQLMAEIIADWQLVLAAETVGVLDKLLAETVTYLTTRTQFKQPLIAFQALQHRIADMSLAIERLRSLMWGACQQRGSANYVRACRQLKVELGKGARWAAQQAVQCHGGIGMTDELLVGAGLKRVTCIELLAGDRDSHLQALAASKGVSPATLSAVA